jgi:hypothetical protein
MLLLLLLGACSSSHAPDGDRDAGASPVVLRVAGSRFTLCRCHHGCGPGADGFAALFADNHGAEEVVVDVTSLALVPEAGGPELSTEAPGGRLDVTDPPPLLRPRAVAPGMHQQLTLDAYIEVTEDPEPLVGLYRVRLGALVDGRAREVLGDRFTVEYGSGDPGCP